MLQQSAEVSRCISSAVYHALQHEVCLQLSSLQASHMHAVQGCLRQAYCGSVQAVPICCAECLVACLHALFQKRSFGQERVISILLAKSWLARPEPARAMYALQIACALSLGRCRSSIVLFLLRQACMHACHGRCIELGVIAGT